jgi:hemerythrin-like domain-containing protein
MEEKVMFPTFEEVTGMTQGPTMIMRMEHDQMRQLLNALQEDLEKKDKNHFFGVSESLNDVNATTQYERRTNALCNG